MDGGEKRLVKRSRGCGKECDGGAGDHGRREPGYGGLLVARGQTLNRIRCGTGSQCRLFGTWAM